MSLTQCTESGRPATTESDEAVLLEWTVHLMHRDPGRATVVYAAAALAFVLGYLLFRSVLFGMVGLFVVFSSAAEYLLPIRYRLTDRRASCAYGLARLEIPWDRVRRIVPLRDGLMLSPLPQSSRLDAFRGVHLRFAPDGQPGCQREVEEIIEARTHRAAAPASAAPEADAPSANGGAPRSKDGQADG